MDRRSGVDRRAQVERRKVNVPVPVERRGGESMIRSVRLGITFLRRHPVLSRLVLLQAVPTMLVYPYLQLMPSMAADFGSCPASRRRKMLSSTTIELSTSIPIPSASPPNETAAAQWFARAAEVGNPIAQNRLARLYATGRGVDADPLAAAKWHLLAKRAGKDDDYLDQFVANLTADQRQVALAASQRWPAN